MKLAPMDVRGEAQLQPAFDVNRGGGERQSVSGRDAWRLDIKEEFRCMRLEKLSYDAKSPS